MNPNIRIKIDEISKRLNDNLNNHLELYNFASEILLTAKVKGINEDNAQVFEEIDASLNDLVCELSDIRDKIFVLTENTMPIELGGDDGN